MIAALSLYKRRSFPKSDTLPRKKKKDTMHIVSFLARKEGFEPSRRF